MPSDDRQTGMEPGLSSEANRRFLESDALFRQGQWQSVDGNYEEAAHLLRKAIHLYENHPYAQELLDRIEQVHPADEIVPADSIPPSTSPPSRRRHSFSLWDVLRDGPTMLLILGIAIIFGWPTLILLIVGVPWALGLAWGLILGITYPIILIISFFALLFAYNAWATDSHLSAALLVTIAALIFIGGTFGIFVLCLHIGTLYAPS
jgi:hypothetical protein